MAEQERTQGKYIIIYEKGSGSTPDYGSVNNIQAGDLVSIYDHGYQTLEVEKVTGSKWTRTIKTKTVTYHGYVITKSIIVDPKTIRKVMRRKPGEAPERTVEEVLDGTKGDRD